MNGTEAQRKKRYPAEAVDTALLPIDPRTEEPIEPRAQPGYYAGFNTLSQSPFWEDATREVVEMRVEQPPEIRYFSAEQASFWRAVFDQLLPQFDRIPERRIPILETLDQRLYRNQGIGYRFETMPPDREAFALGEQAIQAESAHQFGAAFTDLPYTQRDLVLKALHDGKPQAAREIWKRMSVHRFWQMLMQDALEAYYSHPWAWDEIGFGGPAYPRAYMRLERGEPEPWEVEEQRYEWRAPDYAVSHETETRHHLHTESDQNS